MHITLDSSAVLWGAAYAAGGIAFLFSSPGLAAGAWISESGGADMGMASAGRAAIAADATTLAANPAGMAQLRGSGAVAVVMPAKLELKFHGSGTTSGTAHNQAGALPMASAFATQQAGRWTAGLGAYSNLALACDFGGEWAGRRAIEDAQLRSLNLAPAVAYALTERIGVGASLGAQYADVDAGSSVGNDAAHYGPPVGLPDGELRMRGHSWASFANVGATYKADAGTTIGLAWTSAVNHSVGLDVATKGLHPVLGAVLQQSGATTLHLSVPQQITLSAARQVTPDTLLAASLGWQDWSRFGKATLEIDGQGSPMFEDGLRDTWSVAVGLRQRVSPRWTLAGGVSYDSDPSVNGTMPVYFPVAEQLRIAAGADYRASESLLLRMSLSVINQGKIDIGQDRYPVPLPGIPPVTGTIDGSRIYVLGLTADYRP